MVCVECDVVECRGRRDLWVILGGRAGAGAGAVKDLLDFAAE